MTSIRHLLKSLACFGVLTAPAHAAGIYADVGAAASYGNSAVSGEGASPTMGIYSAEASAGLLAFGCLKLGGRTGYSSIVQFSSTDESFGNRRGTRWSMVSPMVGFTYKNLELRVDYQFLGDYVLSTPDESGNTLTFQKPVGVGAELFYRIVRHVSVGARFERVAFSQELSGSTASTLGSPLTLASFGALIHVEF